MAGNENLLDTLRAWTDENELTLAARGLALTLTAAPADRPKPALWLAIDSEDAVGQLTIWASGEAELECAAVATGEARREHRDSGSPAETRAAAAALVAWIEGMAGNTAR